MSILNFPLIQSGEINQLSDLMLFMVNSEIEAVRGDLYRRLPVGEKQHGAQYWCNTIYAIPSGAVPFSRVYGSLYYDTGSWTDPNSVGVFRVPDGTYTHVDIGHTAYFPGGVTGTQYFTPSLYINNAWSNTSDARYDGVGTGFFMTMVWYQIPCNSGDVYHLQKYNVQITTIVPGSTDCCMWIRPVRRA